MNTDDSLIDIDVALANAPYLQLLRRLPAAQAEAFLAEALAWEGAHTLAPRLARYQHAVRGVLRGTPAVAAEADALARRWAERHFERGLNVVLPLMYAEDPRVELKATGDGAAFADRRRGRGMIAVSVHAGPYQALPAYLARLGHRVTSFMDAAAEELIRGVHMAFAPRLTESLEVIGLPSEDATRRALSAVRAGDVLMMMPEFTLGDPRTGRTHQVPFMGRRAYAPTGPARLARALRVPLVPVRLLHPAPGHFEVRFDEPLYLPGNGKDDEAVTDRVFGWLEEQVEQDPAAWWCWEVFDDLIAADEQGPRPAHAAGAGLDRTA